MPAAGHHTPQKLVLDQGRDTGMAAAEPSADSPDTDEDNGSGLFDSLLEQIGNRGKFQKILNYGFSLPLFVVMPLAVMTMMFLVAVPDHWCHVPNWETTNYTLEEWKEITLPREISNTGEERFSKCRMYHVNVSDPEDLESLWQNRKNSSQSERNITDCQYGWDYDDTWYSRTASSHQDWVCSQDYVGSTILSSAEAANVVGSLVFGHLADRVGRKMVFFITLGMRCGFRLLSLAVVNVVPAFVVLNFLSACSMPLIYHAPYTLCLEYSPPEDRGWVNTVVCVSWVLGMGFLSVIVWLGRDWIVIAVIATVPLAFFFGFYRVVPESARWLISRGRLEEAGDILKKIAKINGRTLSPDYKDVLQKLHENHSKAKKIGLLNYVKRPRLVLVAVAVSFCWMVNMMGYYVLQMGFAIMSGNPFLNHFLLSIIELPSYLLGQWLADRLGRRWSQSLFLILEGVCCCIILGITKRPDLHWLTATLSVLAKFCVTLSFYVIYLQAVELYPTSLRSTIMSIGAIVAHSFSTLGPYIVYLGNTDISLPYAILATLSITGGIVASFLPETLNNALPETLEDACQIGRNQKYFSIPSRQAPEKKDRQKKTKEGLEVVSAKDIVKRNDVAQNHT